MKKTTMLLAITLVLGISLVAYAGATKVVFFQGPGAVDEHENASGFAIINETPEDDIETVVQIQIRNAAPNFTYYVWSAGESRGSFTTNKRGSGHFHLNLRSGDTPLGTYLSIRSWDGWDAANTNLVLVYPSWP